MYLALVWVYWCDVGGPFDSNEAGVRANPKQPMLGMSRQGRLPSSRICMTTETFPVAILNPWHSAAVYPRISPQSTHSHRGMPTF